MSTILDLPPLPAGIVIPDTVEELFDSDDGENVVVTIYQNSGKTKWLGSGRGCKKGSIFKAKIPVVKSGTAESWRIIHPENLRCEGTFDGGPFVVDDGDMITLTGKI